MKTFSLIRPWCAARGEPLRSAAHFRVCVLPFLCDHEVVDSLCGRKAALEVER